MYTILPEFLSSVPDFGGSGRVYEPDVLLKTSLLFATGKELRGLDVQVPDDLGNLVESVYGDVWCEIPVHLAKTARKWESERLGAEGASEFFASSNSLMDAELCHNDPDYLGMLANDHDEDRVIFTRLARPNVGLIVLDRTEKLVLANRHQERQFYSQCLITDNPFVVNHFLKKVDPPPEWQQSPLLRNCRPLFLEGGQSIDLPGVTYDDEFGLRIESKNKR
jgi:hypothetical protein